MPLSYAGCRFPGAIDGGEQIERLPAQGAFIFQGEFRNDGGGIAGIEAIGEPLGFFSAAGVAQEFVDIEEARTGQNALKADVIELFQQVLEQRDLGFITRREIAMSTFAGPRLVMVVDGQVRLAKSGACGDEHAIAVSVRISGVEREQIVRRECGDAVGVHFQIVR